MDNRKNNVNLSARQWLEIVVWCVLLLSVFLLKYIFPEKEFIRKFFSGYFQIFWIVILFYFLANMGKSR